MVIVMSMDIPTSYTLTTIMSMETLSFAPFSLENIIYFFFML